MRAPCHLKHVTYTGTFSGTSEAVYLLGSLQNKVAAPAAAIPCQSIVTGNLLGQPVVVITSGMSWVSNIYSCIITMMGVPEL